MNSIILKFSQHTRHEKIAPKGSVGPIQQGFPPPVAKGDVTLVSNPEMSCHASEKMPEGNPSQHLSDCDNLSKMELRKRYSGEASTHRNMLSRQKLKGAIIHPEFQEFVSFLRHVGPMPAQGATLDRIKNTDPEYAPGKVRWADKRTQNNNKSDTLIFHYSRTGDTYTSSRLAKLQGVSPSAIRKRAAHGWTDDEIIEGKRKSASSVSPEKQPVKELAPVYVPTNARDIAFMREAARFKFHREEYGEEAVIAPYEDMIVLEGLQDLTPDQYQRRFAKFWPAWKPHVNLDKIAVSQQQLVAKIDPEYYAKWILAKKARESNKEKI